MAVVRALLQEVESAVVITSDVKAAKLAVPKKLAKKIEVDEYKTETPLPPSAERRGQSVVVLAHELSQPLRVAAAMAIDGRRAVRLLAVVDARSFLDEWESAAEVGNDSGESQTRKPRTHKNEMKDVQNSSRNGLWRPLGPPVGF